ncbi:IS110 family transposase, partial [Escherichia coli]|nr:IS110 family transposase [Escherichia coli]
LTDCIRELLCRKRSFVVTCILTNKLVRIAWALNMFKQ